MMRLRGRDTRAGRNSGWSLGDRHQNCCLQPSKVFSGSTDLETVGREDGSHFENATVILLLLQ
jgi:hypothetical protein